MRTTSLPPSGSGMIPLSRSGKWTRRPERVVLGGELVDPEGVAESGVEAEGIGGVAGGGAGVGGIGGVSRCAGFNRSKETVSCRPLRSRVKNFHCMAVGNGLRTASLRTKT